jgi:hypothetical protein
VNETDTGGMERVETTLIDIVEDAAAAAAMDGTVQLERVDVDNGALATVTLYIRDGGTGSQQEEVSDQ